MGRLIPVQQLELELEPLTPIFLVLTMRGLYLTYLALFYSLALVAQSLHIVDRSDSNCIPFHSSLSPSDVSEDKFSGSSPFVIVSPPGSVKASGNGLELFLDKPGGTIKHKDNTNSKVAEGATVNSTFAVLYVYIHLRLFHKCTYV